MSWDKCLSLIKENVSEQQFNTWFRPIAFESFNESNKTLLVQVPSPFVYEYLEENYVDLLKRVLTRHFGAGVHLSYRIVVDKTNNITQEVQAEPVAKIDDATTRRARMNQPPTTLDAAQPQQIDRKSVV